MNPPTVLFAPNPTGELSVANGVVLWAAWAEARKCGARLLIRIDDIPKPKLYPHQACLEPWPSLVGRAMASVRDAAVLFDIPYQSATVKARCFETRRSLRIQRYYSTADTLRRIGLAKEIAPGCLDVGDIPIMVDYVPRQEFCSVLDIYDYNVPVMVRGGDTVVLEPVERELWGALKDALRLGGFPRVRYIAQFITCPIMRTPLRKESMSLALYYFERWAERFDTPRLLYAALDLLANAKWNRDIYLHGDGRTFQEREDDVFVEIPLRGIRGTE